MRAASRFVVRARYPLLAGAIILLAGVARAALVAAGWPGTDSDDSTMGLIALHILTRGEHPIFFYGQAYMGTIEAYLGALMFALFGVSVFALKLGLIALYAAFMAVMYPLLATLFSRRWALVGLALLSFGSADVLFQELNAYGGYLETLFFGALTLLLALGLARREPPFFGPRARLAGYAAWGLAAGLGIWSDPLVSPFVVITALLIAAFDWRAARGRAGIVALVALLVGVSPWLVYIASARTPAAAASFLQNLPAATPAPSTGSGGRSAPAAPSPLQIAATHLAGVVVVAVPNETGASGVVCQIANGDLWPPSQWGRVSALCLAARGLWGGLYLALLALASVIEAREVWQLWPWRSNGRGAIHAVRLAALLAPAGTILLFSLSSAAASFPWVYARYLITLLIATPVMLGVFWSAGPGSWRWSRVIQGAFWERTGPAASFATGAITAVLLVSLVVGYAGAWSQVAAQPAFFRTQRDLIQRLEAEGDTRVYSEFWTCYRMIFLSQERVVCSVLNNDLSHRPSRYAPYDTLVAATPNPAYVFPLDSSQAANLERVARANGWRIQVTVVDGVYGIYHITPPNTAGAKAANAGFSALQSP